MAQVYRSHLRWKCRWAWGLPPTGAALAARAKLNIGTDVVTGVSTDMFTQMRFILQTQRALTNDTFHKRESMPDKLTVTARQALELATIKSAECFGLDPKIGWLTPGKEADIVLLRKSDINMRAAADPISAIVLHAGVANVDTVIVGGNVVKQNGKLSSSGTCRTVSPSLNGLPNAFTRASFRRIRRMTWHKAVRRRDERGLTENSLHAELMLNVALEKYPKSAAPAKRTYHPASPDAERTDERYACIGATLAAADLRPPPLLPTSSKARGDHVLGKLRIGAGYVGCREAMFTANDICALSGCRALIKGDQAVGALPAKPAIGGDNDISTLIYCKALRMSPDTLFQESRRSASGATQRQLQIFFFVLSFQRAQ